MSKDIKRYLNRLVDANYDTANKQRNIHVAQIKHWQEKGDARREKLAKELLAKLDEKITFINSALDWIDRSPH